MTRVSLIKSLSKIRLTFLALVALGACADRAVVGPPMAVPSDMTAAKGGTQGPTVKSTDPDTATVDSTLNVRVFGSGFDQGSRADWAFEGVVSEKIVTNSTVFVSSSELVANITIARNANIGSHDVIVTTSTGKPGIGTELFEVILKAIDLGTLGGTYSRAYGINNNGDIVGVSESVSGPTRAAFWEKVSDGGWSIRQLPSAPGETQSGAAGINDAGVIAGWSYYRMADGTSNSDAVRWVPGGSAPEDLGTEGWEAGGITLAGQIVGSMRVAGVNRGFRWDNGVITELGHLGGGQSQAYRINSSGHIVGYSRAVPYPEGRTRPVVWKAGGITQLPMLAGATGDAFARNINDAGVIVGSSPNSAGQTRAVRWLPASGEPSGYRIEDLGLGRSVASGINSHGEIVGEYYARNSWRAFYWHPERGKIDLPPLRRGANTQAHGINDAREVVGSGEYLSSGSPLRAIVWIGLP